jgi:hypothetical protein
VLNFGSPVASGVVGRAEDLIVALDCEATAVATDHAAGSVGRDTASACV